MAEICHTARPDEYTARAPPSCKTPWVQTQSGIPSLEHLLAFPPKVTLSLVLSLDGQLCGPDGSSRSISGPEDLEWLRRLRAASDAVIVGAATAAAEGYRDIRIRPEFAPARAAAGMAEHPQLVILHRSDIFSEVLQEVGSRVLLEAGIRLHTVLASHIDRVWISHAPVLVGDQQAGFALPFDDFVLTERWVGEVFVFSCFERVSPR